MSLLGITKIDNEVSRSLKKHSDDLRAKVAAEEEFEQPIIDEIRDAAAKCRSVLQSAITEVAAEKKRLAKDIFADRLIHDVFETIGGDEAAFPQRVYDNHDPCSDSYRAGQRSLNILEQGMCKEWEEISRMSIFKRKDFVLLARRKLMTTIAELEKVREKEVEESKQLEEEIKNLQSTLRLKNQLEAAAEEEFHDAKEVL